MRVMQKLDGEGVELRRKRSLKRRLYTSSLAFYYMLSEFFFVINRVQTLLGILMDMISSVILEYVSMDAWTGMMIFVNTMYTHLY